MMQTADWRQADNAAQGGRLYRSRLRCILVQCQVATAVMVQLSNTIPIALIPGKFITVGILGTAARFGSTNPPRVWAACGPLWAGADALREILGDTAVDVRSS